MILHEARRQVLSPYLLAAVIFTESRFRKMAVSEVGARGLMQLMPATAEEMAALERIPNYNVKMLFEPELNIRLGSRYLSELLYRFSSTQDAIAAYNAGPGNVIRWKKQNDGIAYRETRSYVANVERYQLVFRRLYPEWERSERDS